MDQQDTDENNDVKLPDDVADTWAAVLIDVHEKKKRAAESDAEKESLPNEGDHRITVLGAVASVEIFAVVAYATSFTNSI